MILFTNKILDAIQATAHTDPDKLAIIETSGRRSSYAQLWLDTQAYARGLQARQDVKPGDRILVIVRPGYEVVALIMGIIGAGAIPVVADTAMGYEVFSNRVRSAEPKLIIVEPVLLQLRYLPFAARLMKRWSPDLPDMALFRDKRCVSRRDCKLTHSAQQPESTVTFKRLKFTDPQIIVFTSGTTSQPKAVVHSVGSIESLITTTGQSLRLEHGDRLYSAQLYLIVPALAQAMTMVVPTSSTTTTANLHRQLHQFEVNQMFAAPAQIQDLITAYPTKTFPGSLKCLMLGSAPVTIGFLERLAGYFRGEVWCVYGMTEILPIAVIRAVDKVAFGTAGDVLGAFIDGVDYRIADDGELFVGGPSLCLGYLHDAPLRAVATGDIVRVDGNGQLVLLGRKKDMIIKREYNIYPGLYEPTISCIPGVEACAMVGIFNADKADEEIVLYIEGDVSENYLRAALIEGSHSIDAAAMPNHIVWIKQIPRVGRQLKPDKQRLRKQAAALIT